MSPAIVAAGSSQADSVNWPASQVSAAGSSRRWISALKLETGGALSPLEQVGVAAVRDDGEGEQVRGPLHRLHHVAVGFGRRA